MSNDKSKTAGAGGPLSAPTSPSTSTPSLYRRIDWITFVITTLIVFAGYFYTLAPDLTLEDSGELAVGSYYAGVPHPPGYPVWTLYTWLFTQIPISNIAWRVALSSAVAAALACGLLGLMVSRGSSMLLEGLSDFKGIEPRWENAICLVSGLVSSLLLGFNGFMWSQAVIVEVYTLSVLSFMGVLCCLLRWIYAPEQRRYLYWAFFWFGICFTNHQTLIVAAMGIEVAVLAADRKLGRDMFIGNSLCWIGGLIAKQLGILTTFDNNLPLFMVFNAVGISSVAAAGYTLMKEGRPFSQWKPVLICLLLWVVGASFYFYMPLASMTNPPMNWGYPRTKEGFVHALTRGQYDKTNPTDSIFKFFDQVGMYFGGVVDEYSLVYLLIGLIPFLFFQKMQKRERAWLTGLTAIYLLLAFLLLILLNPNTDKQSRDQTRVFFTSSHIIISILIGYGVTLIGGIVSVLYTRHRQTLLWSGAVACGIQLFFVFDTFGRTLFLLPRAADLLGFIAAVAFTLIVLVFRQQAPLAALLAIFAVAPVRSILSNWSDAEQRGHLFGFWFGHDMFTPPFEGPDKKPLYPEMTRNAILFGGTDPGRFNPTYMIFCESFVPARCKRDPNFDRRDVYLITQNALADKTYLDYIRAHYNRSAQKDPYFFSELFRTTRDVEEYRTNFLARLMLPLDRMFTGIGTDIEARRRKDGVYPPKEIHTPTDLESQVAFQDYITDASRRLQHDAQFPDQPRQIKPGEEVRFTPDGRVQVSGQVAVMAINGLLTKVIFEKNPDHEFFVEESFPLDWMFPHLTPFGIIMRINREPVPELSEDSLNRDHEFWSQYSSRLIGNWINYDTPVKAICEFVEKTYLRRDFTGFTGDRKFVRDEFAQKAFSKLRSAIGGIYSWRLISPDCPMPYRPRNNEVHQRLMKEADFALRQAFAFCPYSPEAVYKYVQLLLSSGRVEDAQLIAETSLKFDTGNLALLGLVNQLRTMKSGLPPIQPQAQASGTQRPFAQLEAKFAAEPTNFQAGLDLAAGYLGAQQTESAIAVLDKIVAHPDADAQTLLSVAQSFAQMGNRAKVDGALEQMRKRIPAMEAAYRSRTNDVGLAFQLISAYLVTQQTNQAIQLTDDLLTRTNSDPSTYLSAAQVYAQLMEPSKLEKALLKLTAAVPMHPEAWYDLAAVQTALAKTNEAVGSLRTALKLSQSRLALEPGSKDLRAQAAEDSRFASLKSNPEFQKVVQGK